MSRNSGAASRIAFVALAAIGVVSVGAWYWRGSTAPTVEAKPNAMLPTDAGPQQKPAPPAQKPADSARVAEQPTDVTVSKQSEPADRSGSPATKPAAKPMSADALFAKAQQLKERGDLVSARDLVNDAFVNGQLPESDVDSAKQFLQEMNGQIILGKQIFAADKYNKSIKVDVGYAASKFAPKCDITAELFGRINGIEPHKIRAGKTYKLIQGPFHIVVSKSRFTADVYLGAPGGPGSLYVKTYRVGLGSDDSTPLGTWLVGPDKLKNPVYYSPRGEGVIAGDDPKNPLGERWVPLEGVEGDAVGKQSYGLHGTIEPESIGKNMSLGCIRMLNADVEVVYDLLVSGKSKVKVVP